MRLSHGVAGVCLAATAGCSSAFLSPIPAGTLSRSPSLVSRGQNYNRLGKVHPRYSAVSTATNARYPGGTYARSRLSMSSNSVPEPSDESPRVGLRRPAIIRTVGNVFGRRRGGGLSEQQKVGDARASNNVQAATSMKNSDGERRDGLRVRSAGDRGWVRRTMAGAAAAVLIRTSFSPSSVSAVPMVGMGRRNPHQQRLDQREQMARQKQAQIAAENKEAMQAKMEREMHQATQEAKEGDVEGVAGSAAVLASEAGAAAGIAAEGVEGAEQVVDAEDAGVVEQVAEVAPAAPAKKLTRRQRAAEFRRKLKSDEFNPNSIQEAPPSYTMAGVVEGSVVIALTVAGLKGSTTVMENQRKRVKAESSKFEKQKEEWIDVEGEAEVDVDIMKELRDLKEKMAGPGDSYAKETRAYNPDFAKEHAEEDYDKKIEEAMRQRERLSRKRDEAFRKKKGLQAAAATSKDEDLLGDEGDDSSRETNEVEESQGDINANAAAQAKKDADVKRLQDLFNSSPSDEGDSSGDDLGDKRELLP